MTSRPPHPRPDAGADGSLYPCGRPLLQFREPLRLAILGATGSIGTQTLDLVKRNPRRLVAAALTCHRDLDGLRRELEALRAACPDAAAPLLAVCDADAHAEAARDPALAPRLLAAGQAGLIEAVEAPGDLHCAVNGLVGAAGLAPTLAAARRGLRIALANKESLVVGGDLVRREVKAHGAEVLPVDSEHSAIAQCLSGRAPGEIAGLILTASGGPFRTTPADELRTVTVEQVLDHPTWDMGPKITVDSATLMNKGLEVIEAHHLFGVDYDRISVVVHPGSTVHSLVEFVDGAVLAQLGAPDMRVPLLYAVSGEKHWPLSGRRLDLLELGSLHFEAPDLERFPCLRLAIEAGRAGGSAPVVLNAANEVAVAALLRRDLSYADLPRIIEDTLSAHEPGPIGSLEEALAVDQRAREAARERIGSLPGRAP